MKLPDLKKVKHFSAVIIIHSYLNAGVQYVSVNPLKLYKEN